MFIPEKVLQEIAYLLSLNDNRMNVLKLMKELYLADRLSIAERDSSISGDNFVSMPHGPALSTTLNLLTSLPYNVWSEVLDKSAAKFFFDVQLRKSISFDRLSKKDKSYIENISEEYKNTDDIGFDLERYTHTLPEWIDPQGSSKKIRFSAIMKALGKTDEEIAEAKSEYEHLEELCSLEQ